MSNYNLTDENGHIINGLRADVMRCCMENKNLLWEKGSIYVGTGETFTVGGEQICKTKALSLGERGEVLMSKGGELTYSLITEDNLHLDFTISSDLLNVCRTSIFGCNKYLARPFNSCICSFSEGGDPSLTEGDILKRGEKTITFPSSRYASSRFVVRGHASDSNSHFGFLTIEIQGADKLDYGLIYLPSSDESNSIYYLPISYYGNYGEDSVPGYFLGNFYILVRRMDNFIRGTYMIDLIGAAFVDPYVCSITKAYLTIIE